MLEAGDDTAVTLGTTTSGAEGTLPIALFNCSEEVIRLGVDSAAGSESICQLNFFFLEDSSCRIETMLQRPKYLKLIVNRIIELFT